MKKKPKKMTSEQKAKRMKSKMGKAAMKMMGGREYK